MAIATIGITALIGALVGDHAYVGGVLRFENVRGNPKLYQVILYTGCPQDRQIDLTKVRIVYTHAKAWDVLKHRTVFGEIRELRMRREIVRIRYSRRDGLPMVTGIQEIYRMPRRIFLPPNWTPGGADVQ